MKVKFYGVRGSIATPGPTTARYGGNTSCVHVELADGTNIVLDAGSGMRMLGSDLIVSEGSIHMLVTHNHWDHIQGFPFFAPIYFPDREIHIASQTVEGFDRLPIFSTLGGPHHPVEISENMARFRSDILLNENQTRDIGNARIVTQPLNHPNGGCAYLIEEDGAKVAYVTDNELKPPYECATSYQQWVSYLQGVDLLIHDAQYLPSDMPAKHGWGHSMISEVLELACDAGVKGVVIYHHDPDRTDDQLDEIKIESETYFKRMESGTKLFCAAEGMEITVNNKVVETN